tara:strand:- start:11498 stop:13891 length:2394 start_codon:yes stop_codon:yes gene_type:complete
MWRITQQRLADEAVLAREDDRIFKPSRRLHAMVEQANAIQRGRRTPMQLAHVFYEGDDRVFVQTSTDKEIPLQPEMSGKNGVLDMYQWHKGQGNDQLEAVIAIQAGIANKYQQTFQKFPGFTTEDEPEQFYPVKETTVDVNTLKPLKPVLPDVGPDRKGVLPEERGLPTEEINRRRHNANRQAEIENQASQQAADEAAARAQPAEPAKLEGDDSTGLSQIAKLLRKIIPGQEAASGFAPIMQAEAAAKAADEAEQQEQEMIDNEENEDDFEDADGFDDKDGDERSKFGTTNNAPHAIALRTDAIENLIYGDSGSSAANAGGYYDPDGRLQATFKGQEQTTDLGYTGQSMLFGDAAHATSGSRGLGPYEAGQAGRGIPGAGQADKYAVAHPKPGVAVPEQGTDGGEAKPLGDRDYFQEMLDRIRSQKVDKNNLTGLRAQAEGEQVALEALRSIDGLGSTPAPAQAAAAVEKQNVASYAASRSTPADAVTDQRLRLIAGQEPIQVSPESTVLQARATALARAGPAPIQGALAEARGQAPGARAPGPANLEPAHLAHLNLPQYRLPPPQPMAPAGLQLGFPGAAAAAPVRPAFFGTQRAIAAPHPALQLEDAPRAAAAAAAAPAAAAAAAVPNGEAEARARKAASTAKGVATRKANAEAKKAAAAAAANIAPDPVSTAQSRADRSGRKNYKEVGKGFGKPQYKHVFKKLGWGDLSDDDFVGGSLKPGPHSERFDKMIYHPDSLHPDVVAFDDACECSMKECGPVGMGMGKRERDDKRPLKGSQEAKDFMAALRAKRKKKE